jgi:hypothetical protein
MRLLDDGATFPELLEPTFGSLPPALLLLKLPSEVLRSIAVAFGAWLTSPSTLPEIPVLLIMALGQVLGRVGHAPS